ncbi:MAG TPA: DUF6418 domain-containing protein [Burkholderiales bacterium]|nr:DUF6418 domain-containing protein [Burkholderiales bacterium]
MADVAASLTGVAFFLVVLGWIVKTRTYVLFALLWVVVQMVSRLASSLYIDAAGPLFSDQLLHYIGPGHASVLLALDYSIYLVVFAIVLYPRPELHPPAVPGSALLSNLVFRLTLAFVALLYADMLRIGPIPFFAGIERYVYTSAYAGPFHKLLFRFGDVLALYLGCFFVLPCREGRRADLRFLYLLLAIFVYAFLAGNRFSAFFKFGTLFAIPWALIAPPDLKSTIAFARRFLPLLLSLTLIAAVMVGYAILHSYFSVRFEDNEDPLVSLQRRVLVQQAEVWWLTYQRVIEAGQWNFARVVNLLFVDPIHPATNTSIQYLMYAALGSDAIGILEKGQQFAGGFPEIFHELFGGFGGVVAVGAYAAMAALVVRELLAALAKGRFFGVLFAGLVLYAFAITSWGGMLNYLLGWTFWAKLAGLLLSCALEPDDWVTRGIQGLWTRIRAAHPPARA